MYSAVSRNKRNTVLIVLIFLVIIGALGFGAGALYGNYSIGFVVLAAASIFALIQYFAASGQALSLSHAQRVDGTTAPRLYRTVENLSITMGMPMPQVYVVVDPAPNAFATGRDPEHAVVAATTGLLEIMDDTELEGVMAHELGHVKNYDIRVSMMVFGLVVAVGFLADILLRMSFFGALTGGNRNSNNGNGGGGGGNPVFLVLGLVAMIIAPIAAAGVQAAVSRQREYLADATGALTTRYPEGLARALEKLGAYGRPMATQNTSMSHLWISDPMKPGAMDRLFSTHPPLADRVARLRESAGTF